MEVIKNTTKLLNMLQNCAYETVGKLQLNKVLKTDHMVAVQIFTQNNSNQLSHLLN